MAAAAVLAGCGGDDGERVDALGSSESVAQWANRASALGVYVGYAYQPMAVADGQSSFSDPACPVVADDGVTMTITGGCVADDDEKTHWLGAATIERDGDDRLLTLDGYGSTSDLAFQSTRSGTVDVRALGGNAYSFDMATSQSGLFAGGATYSGTIEGGYQGASLWNGGGTVTYEGVPVAAETVDQLVDNSICMGQSSSGTTTLRSTAHEVVITYDGADDCDEAAAARWSQDGIEQGLVEGVTCSIIRPTRGSAGAVLVTLLGLCLLLSRRRR